MLTPNHVSRAASFDGITIDDEKGNIMKVATYYDAERCLMNCLGVSEATAKRILAIVDEYGRCGLSNEEN